MRGASARAVGPIPKGSLPAGGGHVRCSQQIVLPWDKWTESGRGGAPYSTKGPLAQWVERRLCKPRVIGSSPIGSTPRRRGRSIKPVRSRRRAVFWGEKMLTRQHKRRVLEALDERLLMEMLLNPVDALCDTWDYGRYRTFRR